MLQFECEKIIKWFSIQHAARYLANQEWVKNDSLKTVENTAVRHTILMLQTSFPFFFLLFLKLGL